VTFSASSGHQHHGRLRPPNQLHPINNNPSPNLKDYHSVFCSCFPQTTPKIQHSATSEPYHYTLHDLAPSTSTRSMQQGHVGSQFLISYIINPILLNLRGTVSIDLSVPLYSVRSRDVTIAMRDARECQSSQRNQDGYGISPSSDWRAALE
jgi:hypothetical protein